MELNLWAAGFCVFFVIGNYLFFFFGEQFLPEISRFWISYLDILFISAILGQFFSIYAQMRICEGAHFLFCAFCGTCSAEFIIFRFRMGFVPFLNKSLGVNSIFLEPFFLPFWNFHILLQKALSKLFAIPGFHKFSCLRKFCKVFQLFFGCGPGNTVIRRRINLSAQRNFYFFTAFALFGRFPGFRSVLNGFWRCFCSRIRLNKFSFTNNSNYVCHFALLFT